MTGFDSLSGDILSATADKMAARDSKKGQMPGTKTGDKASKAFGTHLSRLAQEHEFKSASPKAGDLRVETPRADVRAFALPSGAFDDRALTTAAAKILAVSRLSEEAESSGDKNKDETASAGSVQDAAAPASPIPESRSHILIHHAAMGFAHEMPVTVDAKPSSEPSDTPERAEASVALPAMKADDLRTGTDAVPRMPSDGSDVPELSTMKSAENPDASPQHSGIRAPMPTKVTVVGQETHFEPVLPSATLQQIANSIGEQMPVVRDTVAVPVGVATQEGPERAGAVRTLTLQLDPASLGSVTVKMKLTGAAIEVQIAASRAETAQLLEHDRNALSRLLQASGYQADTASVQVQSVAESSSGGDAGQSASNFQGQSGQSAAQGQFDLPNQRAGEQRPGTQHNQQERRQFPLPQEERHGSDSAARSGTIQSGSLYL